MGGAGQRICWVTPSSVPNAFQDMENARDSRRRAGRDSRNRETREFRCVFRHRLILVSDQIDLIVAGMTPKPEREGVIYFSQPVEFFGKGIIGKMLRRRITAARFNI